MGGRRILPGMKHHADVLDLGQVVVGPLDDRGPGTSRQPVAAGAGKSLDPCRQAFDRHRDLIGGQEETLFLLQDQGELDGFTGQQIDAVGIDPTVLEVSRPGFQVDVADVGDLRPDQHPVVESGIALPESHIPGP